MYHNVSLLKIIYYKKYVQFSLILSITFKISSKLSGKWSRKVNPVELLSFLNRCFSQPPPLIVRRDYASVPESLDNYSLIVLTHITDGHFRS